MRISAFFLPFFAILAGVTGYFLRVSELLNVFDPTTGLPERGAETTTWLIALSIIFMLSILIFAIITSARHKALPGFENAFGTDPLHYPIFFTLIGIVWLVGTLMYFIDINASTAIDIYFIAFSAISAISVTVFAIQMYQNSSRRAPYFFNVIPALFMCFWLVLMYRQNASNPVLLSYVYQCLAIVASALSFYFTAGFLYGKPAPGKSIVAYNAAIFFCAVTLADNHPLGIRLIFCALIAANLVHLAMLVRNLQKKHENHENYA